MRWRWRCGWWWNVGDRVTNIMFSLMSIPHQIFKIIISTSNSESLLCRGHFIWPWTRSFCQCPSAGSSSTWPARGKERSAKKWFKRWNLISRPSNLSSKLAIDDQSLGKFWHSIVWYLDGDNFNFEIDQRIKSTTYSYSWDKRFLIHHSSDFLTHSPCLLYLSTLSDLLP